MSTKLKILEIFNQRGNQYVSGQELADELGLSRNSVWKAIKKLQEQGFSIESKASVGYRLSQVSDLLSGEYIQENLPFPCKVHVFDKIGSTNDYAKEIADLSCPHIILADEQTKGRGRMGRSFYSPPAAGLYMSVVFRPDFEISKAMLITTISALAVCQAFEEVAGVGPKIKWVNDIYLNGRKVCGILTEAESNLETGTIDKIIIGIGVNCFSQVFPEEIKDKAAFIEDPKKEFSRSQLAAAIIDKLFSLINNFDKRRILMEYKSRSMILGQQVLLYGSSYSARPEHGGTGVKARAIDIDENGGLVVEYMEGRHAREMDTITSGEVTIRREII